MIRIYVGILVLAIGSITNATTSTLQIDPRLVEIRRGMLRGSVPLDYLSTQSAVGQIVGARSRFFLTEDNRTTEIVGPSEGIITTQTIRLKSSGFTTDVVSCRPFGW